jgi:hypothetical protein
VRRLLILALAVAAAAGLVAALPALRGLARTVLRPEPPPPITALAVVTPPRPLPTASPRPAPTAPPPAPAPASAPRPTATPAPPPTATPPPPPTATPGPVTVSGRTYDAYIPAATKAQQAYQYSCEFDAAWVIFATFGQDIPVDAMVAVLGVDGRVEPYIEETRDGFVIHGGDIGSRFSGDYRENFLARSTGGAFRKVFAHYGLQAEPVGDRAGVEAALRRGALVWMKTTVDFKPWRPAVWRTPEGAEYRTVLGNDHAVVVIGFNQDVAVIRDVLGPTSSNWRRPYEYEVSWPTFLAAWEAQGFDGLAVSPAR